MQEQFTFRVDLALSRPPRNDISVWVTVSADTEIDAWRLACDIAVGMPARNGMATGEFPSTKIKAHMPVMPVGSHLESVRI